MWFIFLKFYYILQTLSKLLLFILTIWAILSLFCNLLMHKLVFSSLTFGLFSMFVSSHTNAYFLFSVFDFCYVCSTTSVSSSKRSYKLELVSIKNIYSDFYLSHVPEKNQIKEERVQSSCLMPAWMKKFLTLSLNVNIHNV